jgi:pilus assembly protein CpaB
VKIRTILVLVLALVCGGSAAVGVNQWRQQATPAREVATVRIVVAASAVARGAVLTADVLKTYDWPEALVPAGALTSIEAAVDRSVAVPLVQGEPVLEAKLADKEAGRGLASLIPHGMRAFTIQTPHVAAGVGGFVLPGNRVDVLLTTTGGTQDWTGGGITTTLLQNVQVLAVDQRLDAPEGNRVEAEQLKSVTLLVSPDQAAKLDLGMNKGTLHLSLRNPEDIAESEARPATMAQLRLHQERPNTDGPSQVGKVVDLLARVMAARAAAQPEAAGEEAQESPRLAQTQIQTLRGVHRSSVRVDLPR